MPLTPRSGASKKQRVALGFGRLSADVGDHIGQFYERADERVDTVVAFIKAGLDAGEKCVCIMHAGTERELEVGLAAAGVAVEEVKLSGQLVVSPGEDDPGKMKVLLANALSEIPDRFPLLRWAGEMTWSLGKMPTSEKLMEWETHCNTVEEAPAIFLCQYDLTAFQGTVVMDAMKTHPTCIVGSTIHRNPYYQEAEHFLQELRAKSDRAAKA